MVGLTESLQDKHSENAFLQAQSAHTAQEMQIVLGQLQGQSRGAAEVRRPTRSPA